MKKIFCLIMLVCTMICSNVHASDDEMFLSVTDNAGILSDATERYIYTQNQILSEETGARIIIATEKTTGELSVNEYASELYDDLGIEHIGRENSVFIFMCEAGDDYSVIISEGISAAMTDKFAEQCLVKFMEPDFDKKKYDKAAIKTFNAFGNWYDEKYDTGLELTEDMKPYRNMIKDEKEQKQRRTTLIVLAVVFAVVGVLAGLMYIRKKKRMMRLQKKRQERRKRYMQIRQG